MATAIAETQHAAEFLISCANLTRAMEQEELAAGNDLEAGAVLGKYTSDASSSAAGGSNTGDGAMGAATIGDDARVGDYIVLITAAATNAGDFSVTDPVGTVIGTGTVAVLFDATGIMSFTLADGAADFIIGDTFTITVTAVTGKVAELDPDASTGIEAAVGVLLATTDTSDLTEGSRQVTMVARDAEVGIDELKWEATVTAGEKVTALAQLEALGIIARVQG